MNYSFPERNFVPAPLLKAGYEQTKATGRERAAASKVAICGLARDLGARLQELTIPALEAIGRLFGSYQIVLFENDSKDGTLSALRAWRDSNPHVTILSETMNRPKWAQIRHPDRGTQMAEYRNRYRDFICEQNEHPDYVIVLDTDLGQYSLDGILHSLGHDDWDAIGSNGLGKKQSRYYQFDVWAWRELNDPRPRTLEEVHPIVPKRGEPLFRLTSCFGGMGIYQFQAFEKARYQGGDCEHVPFHKQMARVYMNPSQLVLYP